MTNYLSIEDALIIVEELGIPVRDVGLLAGAVARPAASAFGEDAYPELELKIAALIEAINRSHPLVDGNKRLSWLCGVLFARINGFDLSAPQTEINAVIRQVAASERDLASLVGWVSEHLSPLS